MNAPSGTVALDIDAAAITVNGEFYLSYHYDSGAKVGIRYLAYFPGTTREHVTTVVVPFFDAKTPATLKEFKAIDIAGTGTWTLSVGNDPTAVGTFKEVRAIALPTYHYQRIPLGILGTHLLMKLVHDGTTTDEAAVISSIIVHWEPLASR